MYSKRGGCCCAFAFVLEAIALAAALIAITGTFWLDPVVTDAGSVLPGVENAGLWKVCYPEAPRRARDARRYRNIGRRSGRRDALRH